MFKVLTLNAIAEVGLQQFPQTRYMVGSQVTNPDAILLRSSSMLEMQIPATLKAVGRAGTGFNNIPVTELTKIGIPVLTTPGANANAVRELVLAGMLLASRNICQAWNYVAHLQAKEAEFEKEVEANKKQFVGFELLGKTLGVVGLGSIGVKVANAAISLGMRVIGYDPTITVSRAWELSSSVQQAQSIESLLRECDFVSLHVPLTKETKQMINEPLLKLMKPGMTLLNFSRADIVDPQALRAALDAHQILYYVSDFPVPSLQGSPRVICLPHLGASTKEAEENCAVMIVKQMRGFLETGAISNSINFPTIEVPSLASGARLVIINANIPNMVAQISTKLGNAGLNITSLLNKSRDEIACTVIDVNASLDERVLEEVAGIEGVLQVRSISN